MANDVHSMCGWCRGNERSIMTMVLDSVLEKFDSTTEVIADSSEEALLIFRFLHEAIKDSHLYISKVIGFCISVPNSRPRTSTYIARHVEIADSYPEILRNLQDKIFLTTEPRVSIPLSVGANTMDNTAVYKSRVPIQCRSVEKYICRSLRKPCTLNLMLSLSNGYSDMQYNSSLLGNKYFPAYTYFYIGDFVRVLPPVPNDNVVHLRYYHGFTGADLKYILDLNKALFDARNMKEETRKWMLNFGR